MKKFTFLFTYLFILLVTSNINAQWVQVSNGMGNRESVSFTYSGNNLFTGTYGYGIYLSTNNGTSWTQTSLNNLNVLALAANGSYIFAGTNGVYLSTNNGINWVQIFYNYHNIVSLAVNGNNIFAAGDNGNGIYLSTNNGTSWTQCFSSLGSVNSLAISGNIIFAGTVWTGVYLSTNNGSNWSQTSLNNCTVWSLAASGSKIFAGTYLHGVYLSTDNGTTLTQTSLMEDVSSLLLNGNNIYAGVDAGSGRGVYVSCDNGANWTQRNEGLGYTSVSALCILNNYIFAATWGYSVWRRPLSELIGIKPVGISVSENYYLSQNYPNPFNPITRIYFDIPKSTFTKLIIYDILGRELATLVNQQLKPGSYEVEFDGSNLSSGVYFYKLVAGDYINTKKMVLVK